MCWALDRFCFRFRYPPGNGRAPAETVPNTMEMTCAVGACCWGLHGSTYCVYRWAESSPLVPAGVGVYYMNNPSGGIQPKVIEPRPMDMTCAVGACCWGLHGSTYCVYRWAASSPLVPAGSNFPVGFKSNKKIQKGFLAIFSFFGTNRKIPTRWSWCLLHE